MVVLLTLRESILAHPLLEVDGMMKIDDFPPDIGSWVKPSWETNNNIIYSQDPSGFVLKPNREE